MTLIVGKDPKYAPIQFSVRCSSQLKLLPLQEHLEDGLWLVWRDGAHSRDKGGARELADPPQVAAAICEVADGALARAERRLRRRFRRHRGTKQRLQLWVDEPAPRERFADARV